MISNTSKLLQTETITGFEPLDHQFDVYPVLDVPAQLEDAIFGGDAQTYIVFDAATLPSFHGDTGPDICCLFDQPEDEALSPFLLRAQEGNRILRTLFTAGDDLWDAYGSGAFVILRSHASLTALRAHLKKFLKIRDPQDKWFHLRFFEPLFFDAIMHELANDPARLPRWFELADEARIDGWITINAKNNTAKRYVPVYEKPAMPAPFLLDEPYAAAMRAVQEQKLISRINTALKAEIGRPDDIDSDAAVEITAQCISLARHYGLRSERALAHVAGVGHLRNGALSQSDLDGLGWFNDSTIHPNAKARRLFEWEIST